MLQTLSKIGEQLLEGKGIWARLTTEPKYNPDKNNWVCPILFDCDKKEIRILKDEMELFEPEDSVIKFKYLSPSLWGPRGKKCALTIEPSKFSMLKETLFGKEKGDVGSIIRSIDDFPSLKEKAIYAVLSEINRNLVDKSDILDIEEITIELDLPKQDEVVLFYSKVKTNQLDKPDPQNMTHIDGFDEFVTMKFGSNDETEGMDQVTGRLSKKASVAEFDGRFNINKIFQTTSSNYAVGFKNFKNSYQVGSDTIAALDKASKYILNKQDKVRIAGIKHIMIPSFLDKDLDQFDVKETDLFLEKSKDLMFQYRGIEDEFDKTLPDIDLFWVNYIAYETDLKKTYFKITNQVKDVNCYQIIKVIDVFFDTHNEFYQYIGDRRIFNLESIYRIIPVREEKKAKNNPVLKFFKDILEQRQIEPEIIFSHFIELSLCHWYKRYTAFKNINSKFNSFDFAIKDAVFKYSALIYALKQLNLLDMEKEIPLQVEEQDNSTSDYQQRIRAFFDNMEYSEAEKALFYLGRILSSVASAQYKKGHESKPVLNKVNFNGMDADAIVRLSLDLREKTRQYSIHDKTEWNFSEFTDRFNEKDWPLSKEQNVFYLMAGYSFGLTKSDNN